MENMLFYGDNINILKNDIKDESVDLVYLDPPFNSNRDYNHIFSNDGEKSEAQLIAFEDTWYWDSEVEKVYFETVRFSTNSDISKFLVSMRSLLDNSKMMAYLVMMAPRLIELQRVLKKTGVLFLHCDPSASHYLKLLLDAIFGVKNFRNEIIWCYRQGGRGKTAFAKKHDVIFFYSKSNDYKDKFNIDAVRVPYHGTGGFVNNNNGNVVNGKRYKPNEKGKIPEDWWDIPALTPTSKERTGYPTQKPVALLEKIILSSTEEGDIVLDPFCGCGTAIVAAEKLNRSWIGIDVTHLAISTIKERLKDLYGFIPEYISKGEPIDLDGAYNLANSNRYEFQIWALNLLGIKSGMKKGSDGGVDGIQYFQDVTEVGKCIAQVKSGKVSVKDVRELNSVVDREGANVGLLITLNKPTKNMEQEAAAFGIYESNRNDTYPKISIVEVEDLIKHNKKLSDFFPF